MTERHSLADEQQGVRRHAICGGRPNREKPSRAPEQHRIADRLGRGEQQQTPRIFRQRLEAADEALLDPSRQRPCVRQPEPARQLRRRQPARQLQQCERIAPRLRDDPIAHPLIQHEAHRRAQERPRVAVAKTFHLELGQVPKLLARLTFGEDDPHRFGQQSPSHECQRQGRRLVQPLRVIDDAQQRMLLRHLREQAQHRQPDQERIRGRAGAQAEHDLERLGLRSRKPTPPIEHRRAELMQAREGQLHLGLDARRSRDGHIRPRLAEVVQQRSLPDPGLAPQHERPALAVANRREQPVQQRALRASAAQGCAPPRSVGVAIHRRLHRLSRARSLDNRAHLPTSGRALRLRESGPGNLAHGGRPFRPRA